MNPVDRGRIPGTDSEFRQGVSGSFGDTILNVSQERESEKVELRSVKVEGMNMLSFDIEISDVRKHARQDDLLALHQKCEGGLWSSMHSHGDRGNEKIGPIHARIGRVVSTA